MATRSSATTWLALATAGLLALAAGGCSKGKAGSPCAQPADCRSGYYCEGGSCKAGPETACNYLTRCIPLMNEGQAETLFGIPNSGFRRMLQQSPSEGACDAQLKVIASMNRTTVLSRACGPRVTTAP